MSIAATTFQKLPNIALPLSLLVIPPIINYKAAGTIEYTICRKFWLIFNYLYVCTYVLHIIMITPLI